MVVLEARPELDGDFSLLLLLLLEVFEGGGVIPFDELGRFFFLGGGSLSLAGLGDDTTGLETPLVGSGEGLLRFLLLLLSSF